jgi:hypothetical protein
VAKNNKESHTCRVKNNRLRRRWKEFLEAGVAHSQYGVLTTDLTSGVRSPAEAKICPPASVSRPALMPIQPPFQRVPVVKRGRGVMLTTHFHIMPR